MKFFRKKFQKFISFIFLLSIVICQNTVPTCTNFSLYVGTSTDLTINFSSNVNDSQDTSAQLKVIIKSLPSSGSLKSGMSTATVNGQYPLTALTYTGSTSGTYTINFIALDSGSLQSTNTCTLTINVCYFSCDSCTQVGSSSNHYCSSCKSGYYKRSDLLTSCYNSVPVNYYFNSASNLYKPCYSSCVSCSADGDATNNNCLTCKSGYYKKSDYTTTNCFNSAPTGFYLDTSANLWKACHSGCATCEREASSLNTNCLTCNTNYYKMSDNSSQCLNTTPNFYYFNYSTNQYKPCYSSCNTCSADGTYSNHNCLSCRANFYSKIEDSTMCYNSAPDFYYLDLLSNKFKRCHTNCKTCSGAGNGFNNRCLTCKDGLYPQSDMTSNCFDGNISIPNYFLDKRSGIAMFRPCYESCSRCSVEGNFFNHNCLSCQSNFYSKIDDPTRCYQFAPKGYYFDKNMNLFLKCYSSCLTCDTSGDESKNNCTSCRELENFINDPKDSTRCIKNSLNSNVNLSTDQNSNNDDSSQILENSENNNLLTINSFYTPCSTSSDIFNDSLSNTNISPFQVLKIESVTPIYFQKNKTIKSTIIFNNILDGISPLNTISRVSAQNLKTNEIFDLSLDKINCNQLSISLVSGLQIGNYYLYAYDLKGNKIQSGFNLQVSSYTLNQDLKGIEKANPDSIKSITQERNQSIISEVINLSSEQNKTLIVHLYNSSLELKNTIEGDDFSKGLSIISLDEACLNFLKDYYKNSEDLIYSKIDYTVPMLNNTSSFNNNDTAVNFFVYDKIGNLYDLSQCSNINTNINLPVKNSKINIPLARQFSTNFNNANLYDLNDPFYTDICFTYSYNTNIFKTVYTSIMKNNVTFSSNNLTDMPLKYRRLLFYKNMTISCNSQGQWCIFKGFTTDKDYAICECNSGSDYGFYQVSLNYTEMPLDDMNISPLQSMRCNTWVFNDLDANLGGNIGFLLMTCLLVVCFGLTLLVGLTYDPYKQKSNEVIYSHRKIESKNSNLNLPEPKPVGAAPINEEESKLQYNEINENQQEKNNFENQQENQKNEIIENMENWKIQNLIIQKNWKIFTKKIIMISIYLFKILLVLITD
jgi:hypothetical protein